MACLVQGGYFCTEVTQGLWIVSINTIVYSPRHRPSNVTSADPFGQFAWLESMLNSINQSGVLQSQIAVYIIGHIPPTRDQYSFNLEWQAHFVERYFSIIAQFQDIIKGQLFGHVHCNTVRLIDVAPGSVLSKVMPIFLTSAVTPIYQNLPGFRVWQASPQNFELQKYTFHTLSGIIAKDTNDTAIQQSAEHFLNESMSTSLTYWDSIIDNMLSDDVAWASYVEQLWSNSIDEDVMAFQNDCTFRVKSHCAMRYWESELFHQCILETSAVVCSE